MQTGYVSDFSNATFARLVGDSINIDIYNGTGDEVYCSKANKLRQIWNEEPDRVVGNLLSDLLDYLEDNLLKEEKLGVYQKKKIAEMRIMSKRLIGNTVKIELPSKKEDDLQTLLVDINSALSRNKPELVLDRLHTFSTKLLRQFCTDNGIEV